MHSSSKIKVNNLVLLCINLSISIVLLCICNYGKGGNNTWCIDDNHYCIWAQYCNSFYCWLSTCMFNQSALLVESMCPSHSTWSWFKRMCCSYDSDTTISHMNPRSRIVAISCFIVHILCCDNKFYCSHTVSDTTVLVKLVLKLWQKVSSTGLTFKN